MTPIGLREAGHGRNPTWMHRLEHAGFRVGILLSRLLPEGLALRCGETLGYLAGGLLKIRRRAVDENLARAFPSRTEEWRETVAVECYRHLGREAMAVLRFSGRAADDLMARCEIVGLEALQASLARGRGAVLVAGHFGNWELGGGVLAARGIPMEAVATRQANPLVDAEFLRIRKRFGIRIIAKDRAPRELMRALRAGRAVALVADQNAHRGGIFVDFFGTPAATAKGPALFAVRAGAPLWLVAPLALRDGEDGAPLYRLIIEEITAERTGDFEEDVRRLTEAHTNALERHVEAQPEQYFWQHRRWKTRPPQESVAEPQRGPLV